jgi:hypothetical protein
MALRTESISTSPDSDETKAQSMASRAVKKFTGVDKRYRY